MWVYGDPRSTALWVTGCNEQLAVPFPNDGRVSGSPCRLFVAIEEYVVLVRRMTPTQRAHEFLSRNRKVDGAIPKEGSMAMPHATNAILTSEK